MDCFPLLFLSRSRKSYMDSHCDNQPHMPREAFKYLRLIRSQRIQIIAYTLRVMTTGSQKKSVTPAPSCHWASPGLLYMCVYIYIYIYIVFKTLENETKGIQIDKNLLHRTWMIRILKIFISKIFMYT